jgi:tRNA(Ile)-lysidine synthase
LRYAFFRELALTNNISKVATAHTLDDQAETVLLRMLRGTGIRGLAGIHPRLRVASEHASKPVEIVRPLLGIRRAELREFLRQSDQAWREDSTNSDTAFLRNRVRRELLPVIDAFDSDAIEHLANLAEIARAEEEHWQLSHPEVAAERWLCADKSVRATLNPSPSKLAPEAELQTARLLALSLAAQRRLVRSWLQTQGAEKVSFRMIESILDQARGAAGTTSDIPGAGTLRRTRSGLRIEPLSPVEDYSHALPIPGEIDVREIGVRFVVSLLDAQSASEVGTDELLDPARLPATLTVRNWRPGDRFWRAHSKAPQKVKDLLNDRHVAGQEKKMWPVIASGEDLVWMRGFPTPASLQPKPDAHRVLWIKAVEIE